MKIKLIVLVLLLDLGAVLSVSYFHAVANPLYVINGETVEHPAAVQATFDHAGSKNINSNPDRAAASDAQNEAVWNSSLFMRNLVIGFCIVFVINAFLMFILSRRRAASILE